MALFTDTNIISLDDLLRYETTLVQIASSHGIDVNTKIGLAASAIGNKLMLWLLNVGMSDPQWLNRRLLGLSTVVVTPPLRRWLCLESLSYFFAETYNIQLNTRFQGKWSEYREMSGVAANSTLQSGVGIVYKPLSQPALPLVTVSTGTLPAQALFVQTAWTDETGNESAPSPINGMVLPVNSAVSVAMAETPAQAPLAAAGWNIYMSSTSTRLTLQNVAPVAIGSSWSLPAAGVNNNSGIVATQNLGQSPDFYISISKQIQRG
jgi:hypothetical protein